TEETIDMTETPDATYIAAQEAGSGWTTVAAVAGTIIGAAVSVHATTTTLAIPTATATETHPWNLQATPTNGITRTTSKNGTPVMRHRARLLATITQTMVTALEGEDEVGGEDAEALTEAGVVAEAEAASIITGS
ncbi:hypothetical protein IWW50_006893, partial [Coemansia erecta]